MIDLGGKWKVEQGQKDSAVLWQAGEYAGDLTSSTWSPRLGRSVLLGWLNLFGGPLPGEITIEGADGTPSAGSILRPGGNPCPYLAP